MPQVARRVEESRRERHCEVVARIDAHPLPAWVVLSAPDTLHRSSSERNQAVLPIYGQHGYKVLAGRCPTLCAGHVSQPRPKEQEHRRNERPPSNGEEETDGTDDK